MDALVGNRPIRVGGVISQLFAVVGRNWLAFYGIALGFAVLNSVPLLKLVLPKGIGLTIVNAVLVAMQLLGGAVAQAAFTHATTRALASGAFPLGEALRVGLRRFFPYVGATILLLLASGVAAILLLIPGVIVFCVYSQSLVVSIVERLGPIASHSRSRALTRGNRWRVFAVYLVVYLPWLVFFFGLGAFVFLAAANDGPAALAGRTTAIQFATVVVTFLVSPVFWAMPGVLYHHLRQAEGGLGPRDLADVFS